MSRSGPRYTVPRRITLEILLDGARHDCYEVADHLGIREHNANAVLERLANYGLVRALQDGSYKITRDGRNFYHTFSEE